MTWLSLVERAKAIQAIFGDLDPRLEGVRLLEIDMRQDGPSIVLTIDLSDYPESPPRKWLEAKYNTVQMKLSLDSVSTVALEGWGTDNVGDIALRREDDGAITVTFESDHSQFSVRCGFVFVDAISAYRDEAKASP